MLRLVGSGEDGMAAMRTEPLPAPVAWTGQTLQGACDWIDRLDDREAAELEAAASRLPDRTADWLGLTAAELPLPHLGRHIARMADELENGRGFVLLRGLDVRRPIQDVRRMYWVLGLHFGRPITQNARGELMAEVTDRGGRYGVDPHARGYTSSAEMRLHNDPSDAVALLCVRAAREGGESTIVSSMAIYNRVLEEAPEILETLYRGFHYYIRLAETADGDGPRGQVSARRDEMYIYADDRLSGGVNFQSIRSLAMVTGERLSGEEQRALDIVEAIANRPELALHLSLEPGDLLIVNNHMVLHKRTAFTDFAEPEQKRLLLRFWLNLHNGRWLPPDSAKAQARRGFPVTPVVVAGA